MRRFWLVMQTCVLLSLAACAETVETPAVGPQPPTAGDVLQKMATTYAAANTYADHGTVTTVFSGSSSFTKIIMFDTAFVRDQRFRFEYSANRLVPQRYVIWSDFAHTYSQWTVQPGIIDDGPNLSGALSAATGVSGGSARTIASMLLPKVVGYPTASRLGSASIAATEQVDGHPCWRIEASSKNGDPETLWIDRDTYVLRKVVSNVHFARFDAVTTTHYEPSVDVVVESSLLQPPDLTASPPVARKPPPPMPWLGATFVGNTAKISSVLREGPAERAGLQSGDTIVAIGGEPVVSSVEVLGDIVRAGLGARIVVTVSRGGTKLDVTVTITVRPIPLGAGQGKLSGLGGGI